MSVSLNFTELLSNLIVLMDVSNANGRKDQGCQLVSLYVTFSHIIIVYFILNDHFIPLPSPCSLLHFSCFLSPFHEILPSVFITCIFTLSTLLPTPSVLLPSSPSHFLVYTTSGNKNTCAHTYSHTQTHIYLPN